MTKMWIKWNAVNTFQKQCTFSREIQKLWYSKNLRLHFSFFFYQHYIFQFKKRPSFSTYLTQTLLNRIHSRCTVTALWSMWSFVGRSKICVHTETWSTLPSGHLHDEHSLQIQILLNDPSHPSLPVHWEFSLRPKPDHEMQSDQK